MKNFCLHMIDVTVVTDMTERALACPFSITKGSKF